MSHEFPCGTRVLDFVATLRARREEQPYEFLTDAESLDAWWLEAGVRTSGRPSDDADLAASVELREALYTVFWHRLNDLSVPEGALAIVNERAQEAPVSPALTARGVVRDGDPAACLADLAREAIEIVGGGDGALLRECSRPECTTIYLDRSRGHRREWCSMQSCGNRAKAAAYRARVRSARALSS